MVKTIQLKATGKEENRVRGHSGNLLEHIPNNATTDLIFYFDMITCLEKLTRESNPSIDFYICFYHFLSPLVRM